MKTLKAMKEERASLKKEMDSVIETSQVEQRSLNASEIEVFDTNKGKIEKLDEEIRSVEIERVQKGEKQMTVLEEGKLEQRDLDIKAVEGFLKKQDTPETRALQTTTEGAAVIPENVEGMIVEKLEETSLFFQKARRFPSVSGTLKIARENELSDAGFVGEGVDVKDLAIDLGEVTLKQKRVGAALPLSKQLINDAAVNLLAYSTNQLGRRIGKTVEKSALIGKGGEEFAGLVEDKDVEKVKVTAVPTIDELNEAYMTLNPAFLGNAEWIMNRKFFNEVAKLKDGNGHFYLQNGVVNGKFSYTLFGVPVSITTSLTDEIPAVLVDIQSTYALMVKQGFQLIHVTADTTQALRGSQLLVMDGFMDGAVYNPQGAVVLTTTP